MIRMGLSGVVFGIILIVSSTSIAQTYVSEIKRGITACSLLDMFTPQGTIWFRFAGAGLIFGTADDFSQGVTMKVVHYIDVKNQSKTSHFVAITADEIIPDVVAPPLGAKFFAVYGKIRWVEGYPESAKGQVLAIFGERRGADQLLKECITRYKFKTIELRE